MSESPKFLDGFRELGLFAKEDVKKHKRTVQGWTQEPDGLPHVKLGGTVFIHIPTAREWLLNRLRRNSRRTSSNRTESRRQGDAA
jgi:hypothetical protein